MMRRCLLYSGLVVSTLLLTACGGINGDSLSVDTETWLLLDSQVDGQPLQPGDHTITLSFMDGEAMVGNAAVNDYRVPVSITGGQIEHTGPVTMTLMAGPMDAMHLETAYLGALGKAETIKRSSNKLTIMGEGDVLNFTLKP